MAISTNWGSFCAVLMLRDLLVGVYIRAPDTFGNSHRVLRRLPGPVMGRSCPKSGKDAWSVSCNTGCSENWDAFGLQQVFAGCEHAGDAVATCWICGRTKRKDYNPL